MKGAVEPDPSFSPFPKRSDSKSALETVNDENLSIAGETSALEARKAAIVKENMVRIMEKSGIGPSNYRMEPGRILFEMKGDIGSSVVDERHYEKLETFGAYMGDDDFMMPL